MDSIAADLQQGEGTAGDLLTDPADADDLKTLLVKANRSVKGLRSPKDSAG